MEDLIYATWGIAEEYLHNGYLKECVMCLEGLLLCANNTTNAAMSLVRFPIHEAKTRNRLGHVLLKYTNNFSQAKDHLEKALILLGNDSSGDAIMLDSGTTELKFQLYKGLSVAYTHLSDRVLNKHTLTNAYKLAEATKSTHWKEYFRLELTKAHIFEGDATEAMQLLKEGINETKEEPKLQCLYYLTLAQLSICVLKPFKPKQAEMFLEKCSALINQIDAQRLQQQQQQQLLGDTNSNSNSDNNNNANNNSSYNVSDMTIDAVGCSTTPRKILIPQIDFHGTPAALRYNETKNNTNSNSINSSFSDSQTSPMSGEVSDGDDPTVHYLAVHYFILRIAFYYCLGDHSKTEADLASLQQRVKSYQGAIMNQKGKQQQQQQHSHDDNNNNNSNSNSNRQHYNPDGELYKWLNPVSIYIVGHVLHMTHWQATGNFSKAETHYYKANALIDKRLAPLQKVSNQGITFDLETNSEILLLISLKFILCKHKIITDLARCDFLSAVKNIYHARQYVIKYPHIFERFRNDLHILIALYAIGVGELEVGLRHLTYIHDNQNKDEIRAWALVFSINTLLPQISNDEAHRTVYTQLRELESLNEATIDNGLKSAIDLVKAALSHHANQNPTIALKYLQECLMRTTASNKNATNPQLAAQVCLLLGKSYERLSDMTSAQRCMENATLYASRIGDIVSQILSLSELSGVYKKKDNVEEQMELATNTKLIQKTQEFEKRVKDARSSNEHTIISWLPQHDAVYAQMLKELSSVE